MKEYKIFYDKSIKARNERIIRCCFIGIIIFLIGVCVVIKNNCNKEINAVQRYCDSIETASEVNELHYIIGYLYLQTKHERPNKDTVYSFIKSCNVWYPEYIMAQAIIESGAGTSDLSKKANNLFGMKYINQSRPHRPTTQIPDVSYKGYGVYKSWELSVVDRILWELSKYKYTKPTLQKYQNDLSRYAEASTYKNTVISTANKIK
ncbi:MAG: glucosaminidase domain-containing protein [Bacteroidaceae bacterium]|nr:glucosaminidase domain-containing protein [Bacteroidaceae bacterium]